MHISDRLRPGLAALTLVVATAGLAGAPAPAVAKKGNAVKAAGGFELTVDSIMRGPKLVGYPPTGLRWSGDSSRLYFEWRRAGDDEAWTWVVARDGSQPRKLSDEERRTAPPVNGRWDKAHKRVLFADRGDIVLIDASGTRTWITRTTSPESSPRWARNDTAVTYVRDGNLVVAPLDGAGVQQVTDKGPKKADPRLTDSQKFIRDEEEKLLDAVREAKDKKKKADEKDK